MGAEVTIRITNCNLSKPFTCGSPLLPPYVPQGHCHPKRQRGISGDYDSISDIEYKQFNFGYIDAQIIVSKQHLS